jgi:adenine-specific DNA-methyltransferase
MLDDDYDGSNFIVRQIFFSGSENKDEFKKWYKELSKLADKSKKKTEKLLKIEIDEESYNRIYGFKSHPIKYNPNQKIAIRVISQFGEETTKIITL